MAATLLVQLTDPHIREVGRLAYGRVDTAAYLARAVGAISRLKQAADAIVVTGDLTDFGRPAEYRHLAHLLAPLRAPVWLLPGNHDDPDAMRQAFPTHTYLGREGFVQYAADIGPMRLLALDTRVPGQSHGELCTQRLAWLEAQLDAARGRPVVIAMHHPPFETLIGHMDAIGLRRGTQALEHLVARHPRVERIICGHLHRPIDVRFGGTIASTAPSPAHQVCLDLAPDAPSAWTFEPPGFAVHACTEDGRLVSHLATVGPYGGPYPFHENGELID